MSETAQRDGIIAAAMKLAADQAWDDVSLADIAREAGIGLADMRAHFSSKADILIGFTRKIDDQVLSMPTDRTSGQSVRDTLFEVLMNRFDALMPYKAALRSIYDSGAIDPKLVFKLLNSQRWMLAAAGVNNEGVGGAIRSVGLSGVYGRTFRVWLSDDDPGMAKTMSQLDQGLRNGERLLGAAESLRDCARRLARFWCAPRQPSSEPRAPQTPKTTVDEPPYGQQPDTDSGERPTERPASPDG